MEKLTRRISAILLACAIFGAEVICYGTDSYAASGSMISDYLLDETETTTDETLIEETESQSETVVEECSDESLEELTVETDEMQTLSSDENETFTETETNPIEMEFDYELTPVQLQEKSEMSDTVKSVADGVEGTDYVADEVIYLAEDANDAETVASMLGGTLQSYEYEVAVIDLPTDLSVCEAVELSADMDVNLPAVYPNGIRHFDTVVEDDSYNDDILDIVQYTEPDNDFLGTKLDSFNEYRDGTKVDPYLISGSKYYQYYHAVLGTEYAWKHGYRGQGVNVAVIDSGIDSKNSDELGGALQSRKTFVTGSTNVDDQVGHGTHVAGIIAARENGIQGTGIAPKANLYGLKIGAERIEDTYIIGALNWAAKNDIDVINMSLGGNVKTNVFDEALEKLYQKGVVVVSSAGNDGGYQYTYPSCCKHVICVASTTVKNEPSDFTNKSDMVDVSAPGSDIWSTSNTSTDYVMKSGTSMACPVVTGEVAVMLSSGKYDQYTGSAKVDAIEKDLKKSAIKVGAGMGAGIPYLPKALSIDTDSMTPTAPDISYVTNYDGNMDPVSMDITITSSIITHLVYTRDGSKPSYSNGNLKGVEAPQTGDGPDNAVTFTIPIDMNTTQTYKISALCYNDCGLASKVKTLAISVKPYVREIKISGGDTIAQGKSLQLTTDVVPSYAGNKKLSWKVTNESGKEMKAETDGISVSATGKVTTLKNKSVTVKPGDYYVVATAVDRKRITNKYKIHVIADVIIKSAKFSTKTITEYRAGANGTLNIADYLTAQKTDGTAADANDFIFTSSNGKVASVSNVTGEKGKVVLYAPGSAVITATANDGSGKKASVTVVCKQAVTGIDINLKSYAENNSTIYVATGNKLNFGTTVSPSNASNKKVKWEVGRVVDGKFTPLDVTDKSITVSTSGAVTVKKTADTGEYAVRALATDVPNTTVNAVKKFMVTDKKIKAIKTSTKSISMFYRSNYSYDIKSFKVTVDGLDSLYTGCMRVTSSNTDIVKISGIENINGENAINVYIQAVGNKIGKANIVVSAADGSGKKASVAVNVKQDVTKIEVTGKSTTLMRGKKMSLKATASPSNAVKKKIKWSLWQGTPEYEIDYKACGISISSSGVITAKANAVPGEYYAFAELEDNMWVYDFFDFTVTSGGITSIKPDTKNLTLYRVKGINNSPTTGKIKLAIAGTEGYDCAACSVSQTGTNVVSIPAYTYDMSNGILTIDVSATGKATGKSVITVASNDGSGKKAQITVNVVNPPSSLKITSPNNFDCMASGSSKKMTAVVGKEYGKLANSKVKWSVSVDSDYSELAKYITISSNGTLKADKKLFRKTIAIPVTVKAVMADGSGLSDTYTMMVVCYPISKFVYQQNGYLYEKNSYNATVSLKDYQSGKSGVGYVPIMPITLDGRRIDLSLFEFAISVENPQIAGAAYSDSNYDSSFVVDAYMIPKKVGSTKVYFTDKITGKKFTVNLKVTK